MPKIKVLSDRACFPVGGKDEWFEKDAEVEVSAEEFAALQAMEYVGAVVVLVESAKAKKGDGK